MNKVSRVETIERDYSPKGVRFFYIYKALAHPEYQNYVTPFTLEERLLHVREAERTIGSRIPWLADGMDNALMLAFGAMSNPEFIFDPEGKLVIRRTWSDPAALRKDLEQLAGKVDRVTQVEDLDMKKQPPPPTVAKGIVPRVNPGRTVPLVIQPDLASSQVPFYTKLRAEVTPEFFSSGEGKLYLGFHLDPLYRVHWNNEVPPLHYIVDVPIGVELSATAGDAPEVEEPADADPREFLLDIAATVSDEPLNLTVSYFACDDDNTFCVPVTQNYSIDLKRDPTGGSAVRSGRGGARRSGAPDPAVMLRRWDRDGDGKVAVDELPEAAGGFLATLDTDQDGFISSEELGAMRGPTRGSSNDARRRQRNFKEQLLRFDANGDGKLTKAELPERFQQRFDQLDRNGDGVIDERELDALNERPRRRRPF